MSLNWEPGAQAFDRWKEEYVLFKCLNADCPGGPTHRERVDRDSSEYRIGVFCSCCTRECIRDYGNTPAWLRSWIDLCAPAPR